MEQAREGVAGGVTFARLLVTSAEFRDELAEALGMIQQSLRRGGEREQQGRPSRVGQEAETTEEEELGAGYEAEEEEEEEEEEEQAYGVEQGTTPGKGKRGYEPLSQAQIETVARRFVRLLKRVQRKPEFQGSLRFLLERLRTAFELGGLHAERMERKLEESPAGRAFLAETEEAKVKRKGGVWGRGRTVSVLDGADAPEHPQLNLQDHAVRLTEAWMEASLDPLFHALNALNDQLQNDRETRAELAGLGRFAEGELAEASFKGSEEVVVQEAKERVARVRERLLSTSMGPRGIGLLTRFLLCHKSYNRPTTIVCPVELIAC